MTKTARPPEPLTAVVGCFLDDNELDIAEWGEYYPLSLDHRTVNGIIHRSRIEPGDALILNLYVARGDDTPWNLEEVADSIENEWRVAPSDLVYGWYADAFLELDPGVVVSGFVNVPACLLSYWQLGGFKARVRAIAEREGYDELQVLLAIARPLHDAYRAQFTEYEPDPSDLID
jgi:hypothetical protein